MKYLKTWMGVNSDSYLGHSAGYPEKKSKIIETMEELVRTYDKKAEYYKLQPVEVGQTVQEMIGLNG